jgi:mono/diheme cytochrome c family protein
MKAKINPERIWDRNIGLRLPPRPTRLKLLLERGTACSTTLVRTVEMSKAFRERLGRALAASVYVFTTLLPGPSVSAEAAQGKALAKRWCASCHLVERGQTSATDQAPPFTYLARMPGFDENKLAFLLLLPHPNMPQVGLSRAEVADMAEYIATLK